MVKTLEVMLALLPTQVEPAVKHLSQLTHLDFSWFVPDLRLLHGLNKLPDHLNCLKLDITISEFAYYIQQSPAAGPAHHRLKELQMCVSGIIDTCPWQIKPLPSQITTLQLCFREGRQSVTGLASRPCGS